MTGFEIEVDGADPRGWARALAPVRDEGRALLAAFREQARAAAAASGPAGRAGLLALRTALDALHRLRGAPLAAELDGVAAVLGAPRAEVLLANLAYDLAAVARLEGPGCSTLVADGRPGPLHARNLDWRFPGELLRRHLHAFSVRGAPAGPYVLIGWPGLVGALTAVAPGRFSVSVNFVRLRGEHVGRLVARLARGALPVPWAVRDALDHARNYDEAVARLSAAPLLAPAILAIAGATRGEGCVVERSASGFAIRPLDLESRGAVCATNHYLAPGLAGRSVDYDAGSSFARLPAVAARARGARDVASALAALAPTVQEPLTQHQVVMRAADGLCVVRVPGQRARRVRAEAPRRGGRRPARGERAGSGKPG
jgi:hypothetical protein